MNGGMDNPPKRNLRKIHEDPKNVISGTQSIEKEGDASSLASRWGVSEEQVARNIELLDNAFGEVSSETVSEPEEISMDEVLHSYEVTASKGGSGKGTKPAKAAKPSKLNMKKRTHGKKEPKADRAAGDVAYEGDPHYGVPVVTDGVTETWKERHELLRDAVLKSKELAQMRRGGSGKVIELPDQSAELLQQVKSRLDVIKKGDTTGEVSAQETRGDEPIVPVMVQTSTTSEKPQKKMNEYLERTRGQKIRRLSEKLDGFEKQEKPGTKGELREALYEHRAAQIVERAGLSAERSEMLTVQAQYLEAKTLAHKQGFAPENIGDLKKAYTDSLFKWNTALLDAAEKLDGKERLEALVIRKRDTILRPQTIEIEARRAGIDAKVWYGLDKWVNEETPGNLARVVNAPTNLIGKGWATLWHKSAQGNSAEARIARGELGRKYARATRILGGAAGATAIALAASPVTAAAVGLTFAVYTARGVIGTLAGMAGGYAGGGAYQRLFGTKKQESLKFSENVRKQFTSAEEFESFQALYGRSGTRVRSNEKAMWQMAGAMIVGGGTGLATSPLAHGVLEQMGALKSVQDASDTIAPPQEAGSAELVGTTNSPEAPLQASPASVANTVENTTAPVEHVTPTEPENLLKGAVIGKGEGFNTLFDELRDKVRADLPGMEDSSPVMQYLFSASPTELSDRIGAFNPETGASMVMHQGDQLFLDEKGNLWFEKLGETPRLVMENDPSSSQGYVIHEFPKDIEMRAANPVAQTIVRESASESIESVPQEAITASPTESVAPTEVPYEAVSSVPPEQAEEPSIRESVTVPVSGPDAQNAGDLIPRANLGGLNQAADAPIPASILKTQSLDSWAEASMNAEAQVFSNAHGIEINPSEPAGYEWKVPGTNLTYTVAFGENAAATEMWALRELELRPEASVLINYTDTNPTTGAIETNVGAWVTGEDGKPEFVRELVNPQNGLKLSAANPQDFIRKLP